MLHCNEAKESAFFSLVVIRACFAAGIVFMIKIKLRNIKELI